MVILDYLVIEQSFLFDCVYSARPYSVVLSEYLFAIAMDEYQLSVHSALLIGQPIGQRGELIRYDRMVMAPPTGA